MTQQALAVPNLFVIGAMKAGTTTFHRHLSRHPSIFVCSPKEPGYFSSTWITERDEYYNLFQSDAAHSSRYRVDCSTDYSKHPHVKDVPQRIAAESPDARFIYLVRNPIDRAISHYWTHVRDHGHNKGLMESLRSSDLYVDVSDYAAQCKRYLSCFGAERMLILRFEEMVSHAALALDRVWEFLDLPGLNDSRPIHAFQTEASMPRVVRSARLVQFRYRSRLYQQIKWLIPKRVRQYAADRWYYIDNTNSPADLTADEEAQARQYLSDKLAEPMQEFSALCRQHFGMNIEKKW